MFLLEFGAEKKHFCPLLSRNLTDRQKSLIMSFAEDERDVEGTVNGVTATTKGTRMLTSICRFVPSEVFLNICVRCRCFVSSLTVVVLVSVQVGAALVGHLKQGNACMTGRRDS